MAWASACPPQDRRGLGLVDLHFFGIALRFNWESLCRVDLGKAWAELPYRDDKVMQLAFSVATDSVIGNGKTMLSGLDRWNNGQCISVIAPTLFAIVHKRSHWRTVVEAVSANAWVHDIVEALAV